MRLADGPDERHDARDLLLGRDRRPPAHRGLPADVDDRRAGGDLLGGAGDQIGWSPPSENESGDAFTTPISSGGPPSSSSRRPARSLT